MEAHMNSTTDTAARSSALGTRVLREGYGPGAWHGPDLQTALADVTPALAYWRPAAGRHNIAEIAVHHAFYAHSVSGRLGAALEPFALDGDDWFPISATGPLTWPQVLDLVERQQRQLADAIAAIEGGRTASALSETERFDLILGITCHAVYHAGQVQLIKRLHAA
jgi:hypothetical protein